MDRSIRRFSKKREDDDEEEESDQSAESLIIEEKVKRLLNIDFNGQCKKNIFNGTEEKNQKIRRSIIKRALRDVVSSTPMPTKGNFGFFLTESSLNISPINSENHEISANDKIEIGNPKEIVSPKLPAISETVVISDSDSESKPPIDNDKNQSKSYFTRSQAKKGISGEPNYLNSKETQEHIGLAVLNHSSAIHTKSTSIKEIQIDLAVTPQNAKTVCTRSDISKVVSVEKQCKTGENLSKSSHGTKCFEKALDTTQEKFENEVHKHRRTFAKSPSAKTTEKSSELQKSPHQTKIVEKTSETLHYSWKSTCHTEIVEKLSINQLKSAEKSYRTKASESEIHTSLTSKEKSLINRSRSEKNSNLNEKDMSTDIHRSVNISKNSKSINSSPVKESRDESMTRIDNWVRETSKQCVMTRQNKSQTNISSVESKKTTEEGANEPLTNLKDKPSMIPVSRQRSKSREKTNESQVKSKTPDKNKQNENNSNVDSSEGETVGSPLKPLPRRRKQTRAAILKSTKNSGSIIQKEHSRELTEKNAEITPSHSNSVFHINAKCLVDTATSPTVFRKEKAKGSITSGVKRVKETGISPISFNTSSSMEKEERAKRLDQIILKMAEQQKSAEPSNSGTQAGSKPASNLVLELIATTQNKQVQTSLRTSNKFSKAVATKKNCARNIFSQNKAERETQTNEIIPITKNQQVIANEDDTSLSSATTEHSKLLEEYDGFLFESLGKSILPEWFSSHNSIDYSPETTGRVPWRYENPLSRSPPNRMSVKLNFLRSADKIEEDKENPALSRKRLESDSDFLDSVFVESTKKIDYIDKTQDRQELLRPKNTFRDYSCKSAKKATNSTVISATQDEECLNEVASEDIVEGAEDHTLIEDTDSDRSPVEERHVSHSEKEDEICQMRNNISNIEKTSTVTKSIVQNKSHTGTNIDNAEQEQENTHPSNIQEVSSSIPSQKAVTSVRLEDLTGLEKDKVPSNEVADDGDDLVNRLGQNQPTKLSCLQNPMETTPKKSRSSVSPSKQDKLKSRKKSQMETDSGSNDEIIITTRRRKYKKKSVRGKNIFTHSNIEQEDKPNEKVNLSEAHKKNKEHNVEHNSPVSEPNIELPENSQALKGDDQLGFHKERELIVNLHRISPGKMVVLDKDCGDPEPNSSRKLYESFKDLALPFSKSPSSTRQETTATGGNSKEVDINANEEFQDPPKKKSKSRTKRAKNISSNVDEASMANKDQSSLDLRRSNRERKRPKIRYPLPWDQTTESLDYRDKRSIFKPKSIKRSVLDNINETDEQPKSKILKNDEKEKKSTGKQGRKKGKKINQLNPGEDEPLSTRKKTSEKTQTSAKTITNNLSSDNIKSASTVIETVAHIHSSNVINNQDDIDSIASHFDPITPGNDQHYEELEDEHFLRVPSTHNMLSRDSGTSTLLKSHTFELSNLRSTKQRGKVNKSPKKRNGVMKDRISKVASRTVGSPSKNDTDVLDDMDEYVHVLAGSDILRLKYVENDPQFRTSQDDLSFTNFIKHVNGATMGYLKIPAGGKKPIHTAKRHALCYFVLEGEGRIFVHNKTSKIGKLSHFVVPMGVEYAILNDSSQDMLLACVRMVSS